MFVLVVGFVVWYVVYVIQSFLVIIFGQMVEFYLGDIKLVLFMVEQIQVCIVEFGEQIGNDYCELFVIIGQDLLLIIVLKGVVFFVIDLV